MASNKAYRRVELTSSERGGYAFVNGPIAYENDITG
jgi:hypothetical protein